MKRKASQVTEGRSSPVYVAPLTYFFCRLLLNVLGSPPKAHLPRRSVLLFLLRGQRIIICCLRFLSRMSIVCSSSSVSLINTLVPWLIPLSVEAPPNLGSPLEQPCMQFVPFCMIIFLTCFLSSGSSERPKYDSLSCLNLFYNSPRQAQNGKDWKGEVKWGSAI